MSYDCLSHNYFKPRLGGAFLSVHITWNCNITVTKLSYYLADEHLP